jgi:uncharacterized protein (TIGR02118 family)
LPVPNVFEKTHLVPERPMPGAKIVVLYPQPTDVDAFDRVYLDEHVPLAKAKIGGASRFIFTIVRGALGGASPYYRITEIHFPSMEALQASAASASTQEAAGHAVAISSGGPPLFLIADETTMELSRTGASAEAAQAV